MNPNPVPEAETKRFADLLSNTLARANQLPDAELGQTLRTAIATFMLQGDILGKILASQAGNVNELSQMLATVTTRLDQIQTALADLLNWAKAQQSQQGDDSDWWKN
jgi:hypothetical protein